MSSALADLPEQRCLRVAVADGHPVTRHGLAQVLAQVEILACGPKLDDDDLREIRGADLVLLDPITLGQHPVDLVTRVVAAMPQARVLLFSHRLSGEAVLGSITAGGAGYLRKSLDGEQLNAAVRAVARGHVLIDQETQNEIAEHLVRREAEAALTPRERDVLWLAARGFGAEAMAAELHISVTTVKSHLGRAYQKLGATNRAGAVAAALRAGLLEEPALR